MPATLDFEANDIYVLRISGELKQSEFADQQKRLAGKIDAGAKPRLLVIGDNFEGWERKADWNDLDFMLAYSGEIVRIAIVAESKWEAHALAFAGAGIRRAPVKLFPPDKLAEARAWLAE